MDSSTQTRLPEADGIKELAKAASLRLRPLKTSNPLETGNTLKFIPADDEPTSPVTPVGRAFSQPDMSVVILCIVGLAEKPGLQQMQEFLRGTLVKHKRFHSIMVRPESLESLSKCFRIRLPDCVSERLTERHHVLARCVHVSPGTYMVLT
jgi:hypothetical protein